MNATGYQRCIRCVMDTTDSNIVFDEAGICSNCTNWLEIWANKIDRRPIEDIIQVIKQLSKGKYDGVVGISGGVDSSMVAYLAHKHGLNVLLVHVGDNVSLDKAIRKVLYCNSVHTIWTGSSSEFWDGFHDSDGRACPLFQFE